MLFYQEIITPHGCFNTQLGLPLLHSFFCPRGVILFRIIIFMMPLWLILWIKYTFICSLANIFPFAFPFPGAWSGQGRSSVLWWGVQKAVVAVLIGWREQHYKWVRLSREICTKDPYLHWHFIGCLDLLIHCEKCRLCSTGEGFGNSAWSGNDSYSHRRTLLNIIMYEI